MQAHRRLRSLQPPSVLILCLGIIFAPGYLAGTVFGAGEDDAVFRLPATLEGEDLTFGVGFWLFKNAAHAHMSFKKAEEGYVASFEVQTSGFIGLITRNMKEVMQSTMRYDPQKRRLQPLSFQETITQGDRIRIKTVTFNYEKRIFTFTQEGTNKKKIEITGRLPKKDCDDLLTAFYNLRLGSYGPIKKGRDIPITACVKERPSRLLIVVPEQDKKAPERVCRGDYYMMLSMEKDLTNIASKKVSGWFDKDLVPLCGIIEDAYFFGDIQVIQKERQIAK